MTTHKIWIEQCHAARGIEDEFGTQKALAYLVGEKFINFLDAAQDDADFHAEISAFVAEIKTMFEPWQLAEFLETARQTEPFDPSVYDDEEEAHTERQLELRKSAAELLLVERAREWLLGARTSIIGIRRMLSRRLVHSARMSNHVWAAPNDQ